MKLTEGKISEVFFSIQGEGLYTGTPHIFVRFFGCNIDCSYCDTKLTKYNIYNIRSLKKAVDALKQRYNARYISLTGGEPLLQNDFIYKFLGQVGFKKQFVYLETNGILYHNFQLIKDRVDIVAMDIKLPDAVNKQEFWPEHKKFLKLCLDKEVFVKIVVTVSTKLADIKKAVTLIKEVDENIPLVLQPNYSEWTEKLIRKCKELQTTALHDLKDVRVIPQMHKIMGLR
ncbi:MAG: 7-carboxy-7-deazaguanine synthase QueE [PVC group bacterium]|nr:7-carboxy-7-deazaguanine synthase QueE [PVC group bacterium]